MGALWLLVGLGMAPWYCSSNTLRAGGQLFQSRRSSQVIAMLLLGLIPWSDRKLMPGVEGQLFGGGEASFGYSDLISPRVDSDISDYYYDYQDQVWTFMLRNSLRLALQKSQFKSGGEGYNRIQLKFKILMLGV